MTEKKSESFNTSLGQKTMSEIQEAATSIPLSDKIYKWTQELCDIFPKKKNQIEKLMNLLHFSQDYFVQQTLLYAPKEVSFCLMNNCLNDNMSMNYDLSTLKIEVNPIFVQSQLVQEDNLLAGGTFLKKLIHELTHGAQAGCGVYPTYIPQMTFHNALICEFMTEVDAFIVETRFMYELMKPVLMQSKTLSDTEVGAYYSYIERMNNMNLTDENKQLYADVMVAAILLDFPKSPKQYNNWQQNYLNQTYTHLLARPIKSLILNDKKMNYQEKYMYDYYDNHFPILSRIKQQLIQNLNLKPLEQAIIIGERLPNNEGISYRDIHKAQIKLGMKNKSSTVYQILSAIRYNKSR